ncbi:MAG: hypothetical protein A4E53_01661 [Pelotomaculum sp. PtaB.Bin104]|nr:MAG: hypothetical protein A4E53_01661 [Pelotomaculum sp. PtaB.Bin104]
MTEQPGTAQASTNAEKGVAPETKQNQTPETKQQTPEQLHEAALAAVEAYQADPTDELKEAAKTATQKAKEAFAESKKVAEKAKKEAEEAAAKNKPPEKYEVKLQEKNSLPPERVTKIVAFAKERGFSNEQAQEAVSLVEEAVLEHKAAEEETVNQLRDVEWPKQAKEDKEIGGEKFKENVEIAKRALNKFASKELNKLLKETGMGNHPEVLRVFVNIGKAMADDSLALGSQATGEEKDLASVFYGGGDKK